MWKDGRNQEEAGELEHQSGKKLIWKGEDKIWNLELIVAKQRKQQEKCNLKENRKWRIANSKLNYNCIDSPRFIYTYNFIIIYDVKL